MENKVSELRSGQTTKLCPFCGESIMAVAIKCKHCGSRLDAAGRATLRRVPPAAVGASICSGLLAAGTLLPWAVSTFRSQSGLELHGDGVGDGVIILVAAALLTALSVVGAVSRRFGRGAGVVVMLLGGGACATAIADLIRLLEVVEGTPFSVGGGIYLCLVSAAVLFVTGLAVVIGGDPNKAKTGWRDAVKAAEAAK
jgi:hypothetical protein